MLRHSAIRNSHPSDWHDHAKPVYFSSEDNLGNLLRMCQHHSRGCHQSQNSTSHGSIQNLLNYKTAELRKIIKLKRLFESWQRSERRDKNLRSRALRLIRLMRLLRLQVALGHIPDIPVGDGITTRFLCLAFQCIAVSLKIVQRKVCAHRLTIGVCRRHWA